MSTALAERESAQLSFDLTEEEQSELETCERIIERNLKAFMETGGALMTISDKRLYRATHTSFESYCREKWGISRQYGYELMQAATIAGELTGIPDIPAPANASQVRPLGKLETPEERQEAWTEAVETAPEGKVTAAHVQAVVEKRTEPEKLERPDTSNLLKPVPASMSDVLGPAKPDKPTTPEAPKVVDNRTSTSPPAPAPAKPAEAAAPSGAMVQALIPADEDDWLWEQGLTAATAIAKLREVMQQLDLANEALQRPQLTPVAESALLKMVAHINANREDQISPAAWIETLIMTRAQSMGVLEDNDDEQ